MPDADSERDRSHHSPSKVSSAPTIAETSGITNVNSSPGSFDPATPPSDGDGLGNAFQAAPMRSIGTILIGWGQV
jgi:hypothetical protein